MQWQLISNILTKYLFIIKASLSNKYILRFITPYIIMIIKSGIKFLISGYIKKNINFFKNLYKITFNTLNFI